MRYAMYVCCQYWQTFRCIFFRIIHSNAYTRCKLYAMQKVKFKSKNVLIAKLINYTVKTLLSDFPCQKLLGL